LHWAADLFHQLQIDLVARQCVLFEEPAGLVGRPATAHDIAEAQGAPNRFLLRALKALVAAGLPRSAAGPGGGYRLGRPAARITLLEVVEAVDGPIRGEAPLGLEGRHGFDSRLGAVCQAVADRVRRSLGRARVQDLFGQRQALTQAAPSRDRRGRAGR
jgi:Rrf2 family protein